MRSRALVFAVAMGGALLAPSVAHAQDPAGCTDNSFQLAIGKDRTYIRDGETINYTVSYRNDTPKGCTVSAANILLQLPSATGEPSATAQQLTFNETFPFGTGLITRGPFPYTAHFGATPPARYTARTSITHGQL